MTYDVENRQTGFSSISNGTATYTYDGDGRRVTKTTGGVTTTYVYDAKGDLASEYSTQPPPPPCLTCYVTTDHLGSTRVVTDETAAITARHDFLPFGEELTTSNRTAALGYGAYDNVMHKYTWSETFNYDIYGNRWVPSSSGISLSALTVTSDAYNTLTNRLTSGNFGYDTAGNETTISPFTVTYDVENRQTEFSSTSNGTATYTYDGDGRRVTKTTSGVTTTYVYDAKGDLAAEYSTQPPPPACLTCYITTDHLGSTRAVTDENAAVTARHDFLPFGEELTTSNRTAALGYGAYDNVMHKYAGKERDAESGLDWFEARYLSSAQGRFTSPDDPLADQSASDPQSWNLYSYVRNNPLVNVDPSGQDCITTSNQTDKSVSVTVASGTCNGNVGTYVSGTVNTSSLTYNGTSVGYTFTPYDTATSNVGFGSVPLGPSPTSSSDINPFGLAVVQAVGQRANSMYGLMAAFAGGSLLGGAAVAGGLTFSGAGLTSLGLNAARAAAPFLPAVPSAIQKLQKIGLSLEQANEIVQSPASQKLIDNANNGNINCIQQVGDKLVRITTDPTGQRIISAGYVRANGIANGIANGRFTTK